VNPSFPTLTWFDPVANMPGLGAARVDFLRENEYHTVGDAVAAGALADS
jgi:hypothetical protein